MFGLVERDCRNADELVIEQTRVAIGALKLSFLPPATYSKSRRSVQTKEIDIRDFKRGARPFQLRDTDTGSQLDRFHILDLNQKVLDLPRILINRNNIDSVEDAH